MARWRQPGANEILLVLLLLAAAGFIVGWLSHRSSPPDHPLSSFLATAFLIWRVARGGRISRVLVIIGSVAFLAASALAIARRWDVAAVALVTISAAAIALLTSPPSTDAPGPRRSQSGRRAGRRSSAGRRRGCSPAGCSRESS